MSSEPVSEPTQTVVFENEDDVQFDVSAITAQSATGSNSTVIPASAQDDQNDILNDDFLFDEVSSDFLVDGHFIRDKTIQNIEQNSVNYTPEIGRWLLKQDDLIPSILTMFEGLVMGSDGLMVDPKDPKEDADNELADHMNEVYYGHETDSRVGHVKPAKVVRQILMDNALWARSVLRSTDLKPVDLEHVDLQTDGDSGKTFYIQEQQSYKNIDVNDNGTFNVEIVERDQQIALRPGEDVFDARLYRSPPVRSVSDEIVNKLQLKRFKARKSEVASIGGIYIKVNPPAWLPEDMYFEEVAPDDNPYGDTSAKKLEVATQRDIDAALDTLKDYQTATIMSIPEHWEVQTVELPEMDETFDEMIEGYNQDISRRMLLPFDLMELAEKGQMLSAAVAAWQREILRVFDQFAAFEAQDHNISGAVEHRFPSLEVENEKLLIRSLAYAGLLGLSQEEARGIVNSLEGIELDEEVEQEEMPPVDEMSPQQKEETARQLLQQNGGNSDSSDDSSGSPEGTEDVTPPSALDPEIPKDEGEAAAQFNSTDVVDIGNGNIGIVLEVQTSNFEWPGGDGDTEVEASRDNPVYIVAKETGGSDVYEESELTSGEFPDDVEAPIEDLEAASPAPIYDVLGGEDDVIEALNIPGVDDPEVGFAPGEPEGWTRLSYLRAYASVGGSWTSCVSRMTGDVSRPERWCSALKDEVFGTEEWR